MAINNGFILQYGVRVFNSGKSVAANGTYDVSHNYPRAFSRLAATNIMNTYNQAFKASVHNRSVTGFSCTLKNVGGSTAAVEGFIWLCVGY